MTIFPECSTNLERAIIVDDEHEVRRLLNSHNYEEEGHGFIYAIKNGSFAIVEMLLEEHREQDFSDIEGLTPLMYAIINSQYRIVEDLHRSDINAQCHSGRTPLSFAAESDSYMVE